VTSDQLSNATPQAREYIKKAAEQVICMRSLSVSQGACPAWGY
jgi:hypothetical protein